MQLRKSLSQARSLKPRLRAAVPQSTMSYVSIAGLTISIKQLLSLGENELKHMYVNWRDAR